MVSLKKLFALDLDWDFQLIKLQEIKGLFQRSFTDFSK